MANRVLMRKLSKLSKHSPSLREFTREFSFLPSFERTHESGRLSFRSVSTKTGRFGGNLTFGLSRDSNDIVERIVKRIVKASIERRWSVVGQPKRDTVSRITYKTRLIIGGRYRAVSTVPFYSPRRTHSLSLSLSRAKQLINQKDESTKGGNRFLSRWNDSGDGRNEDWEDEKQRGFAWNFHLAAVRNYAEGRNRGRNRVWTRK